MNLPHLDKEKMKELHKIRLYRCIDIKSGLHNRGYLIEIICETVAYKKELAWYGGYKKALIYAKLKAKELNLELINDVKHKKN